MKRALVVYYSRTGTTDVVAREIADRLDCDIAIIRDTKDRRGLAGYLRSVWDVTTRAEAKLRDPQPDPRGYELVIVGSPNWSTVATPVRTWMLQHAKEMGKVALFMTYGGSGLRRAIGEFAALCPRPPVAELALRQSAVERGTHHEELARFVRVCAAELPAPPPPMAPEPPPAYA